MASVEERLKLKRGQVDTWSTREKLCLASCVVRSGNQNWMSVSRNMKVFAGEPERPNDWFSQKSCAVQYDNLLDHIETPKRKKRGADGTKIEGPAETPADTILKQLTVERIAELKKEMDELRTTFMKLKEEVFLVESGQADDRLEEMLQQIKEEKLRKEAEQEENARWIRQREERKHELELAWRPHATQQHYRNSGGLPAQSAHSARRASSQSELSSEADSPVNTDQLNAVEETMEVKPAPTPTSPLLTSLLKSPSPVTGAQSSSILHSAITSQRGASPTITSLLNSSPSIPTASTSLPVSPNIKSLVSNALAGHDDIPKPLTHTSSSASGSPTLSMLLELPPSAPGQPLPELPYSATKQPASTVPAANKTDPAVKEPLPDLGNVELVLPIEAEAKITEAESKLNLDSNELQDLSNSDLELVMDDVVLEELVPEGLVEEMSVFIEVSSEDVETSVNNILEATEQMENSNLTATNADQKDSIKKEVLPEVSSESDEHVTTEAGDSPKTAVQPNELVLSKENEEEPRSNEALSREALENASIVIVQDNGELVKLQDSVERTQVVGDIQIIQETTNNDVVVVPLEGVEEESDKEDIQNLQAGKSEQSSEIINEKVGFESPTKDERHVEASTRVRSPKKSEKRDIGIEEDSISKDRTPATDTSIVENVSTLPEVIEVKSPNKIEVSAAVDVQSKGERLTVEESKEIVKSSDVTPKEGKRRKSLSLLKREKSPVVLENTDEVVVEDDKEAKQDSGSVKEENDMEMRENIILISDKKSSVLPENISIQVKEDKVERAETPSTEDDKSRDAEQPTPLAAKPRKGRLGRDSMAYSDSVPNSPAPCTPTDDEKEYRVWKKSIMLVYGRIATHKNASIFFRPITDDKAPGYSQMIYRPIDLSTIKKNVETGVTRTTDEFQRDILLMFNNAIMYNKSGTPVHDMALEMQEEVVKHLKEYVTTQMLVQGVGPDSGHVPSRRGTRTAERREQDSDGFSSRRGLADRGSASKGSTLASANLGKRKRSFPDDKSTPKRRKDDD